MAAICNTECLRQQDREHRGEPRMSVTRLGRALARAVGFTPDQPALSISERSATTKPTEVDVYWGEHTTHSTAFNSAEESRQYLEWRFGQYPFFRELMELWGEHDDRVVLDYGCGPGNDLTGFLVYTKARKVIGIDVSAKALQLAGRRLALHQIDPSRVELIKISDSTREIPLEARSVDYIYCEGVLHHTTYPEAMLTELRRTLKPAGSACIMVYNRNSLWFHLYTAYDKMILRKAFPGLTVEQAFSRNTDGEHCPISRCYHPDEFMDLCHRAGFQGEFAGGYFSTLELELFEGGGNQAACDDRLPSVHREFLRGLRCDTKGFPQYRGKYAGIGGVYKLRMA